MEGEPAARQRRRILIRAVGDETVASTRARMLAHLPALEAAGYETAVELQRTPRGRFHRLPGRLLELATDCWGALPADILLVHRRTYPPFFARRLRRPGIPLVFDLDDALYLPPPSASQAGRTHERYRRNFLATVAAADHVLCGNRELASHLPHQRFTLVPTSVDCRRFAPGVVAAGSGPVAGWVGHSDNLPDLEALAEPLEEIARRRSDFKLVVAADRPPELPGITVEFRRWTLESELSCFADITVGLMPLVDTPWTRAKCAFKLLQYMALGIPAVASPVGMNADVISDDVNGLLAAAPDDWVRALDTVFGNPELARRLADNGRRTVEDQYSLAVGSDRLVDVLATVCPPGPGRLPG